MTDELRRNMAALERSREDLRDSLERIGDTLTSTHDLDGLLQVVLETAVVTLQARAGRRAARSRPTGCSWSPSTGCTRPACRRPPRSRRGRASSAGCVATGEGVRGRLGSGPVMLEPSATEPGRGRGARGTAAQHGQRHRRGRALRPGRRPALRGRPTRTRCAPSPARPSIAIDNVHLHHEAQRLSTTDPLTGLWNFRYLSMSLAREIERSTRFDRPLAVLMLDLDHFKLVNDLHGHARGDSVLRELAHRVQEQIREVDTFARYGGEEFVVVLPGDHGRGRRPARRAHLPRGTPRAVPGRGRGAAGHHGLDRRGGLPGARLDARRP